MKIFFSKPAIFSAMQDGGNEILEEYCPTFPTSLAMDCVAAVRHLTVHIYCIARTLAGSLSLTVSLVLKSSSLQNNLPENIYCTITLSWQNINSEILENQNFVQMTQKCMNSYIGKILKLIMTLQEIL